MANAHAKPLHAFCVLRVFAFVIQRIQLALFRGNLVL